MKAAERRRLSDCLLIILAALAVGQAAWAVSGVEWQGQAAALAEIFAGVFSWGGDDAGGEEE